MRLTDTERQQLHDAMTALLDEYDYSYEHTAIDKIIGEWEAKKGWLVDAFKHHPNYVDGKYLIAFDTDYEREIDMDAIFNFRRWVMNECVRVEDYRQKLPGECRYKGRWFKANAQYNIFDYLHCFDKRTLTESQVIQINEAFPTVNAKVGEKTSRVINRLCTYLHYNEHPDYNREFAKYADALSPMRIKRHTVISLNPLDYLTMSFGNSWSSCHTIDKTNKRRMDSGYGGMYSSGTMSYMLDAHSLVLYTVDKAYTGTDYFTQPKIIRQMYHFGEEKLVQGRLYPQSSDGKTDTYEMYRKIVQEVMATIFDFPNLWTVSRRIGDYVNSDGTHYRDYAHFNYCTLSAVAGTHNTSRFTIGAQPICIECGERHNTRDNINCCVDAVRCADCGRRIHRGNAHEIDGKYYCDDCCRWCDNCEEWTRDELTEVRDDYYVCQRCLDNDYTWCSRCEEYHRNGYMHYLDVDDAYYCDDCYWARVAELEAENEDTENTENTDTENVEWRVVDRAPRVGDYIRLVGKEWSWNEVGDILRVDCVYNSGAPGVYGMHHPRKTDNSTELWGYWSSRNYEVVERVNESEDAQ